MSNSLKPRCTLYYSLTNQLHAAVLLNTLRLPPRGTTLPTFYGTCMFTILFTAASQLSQSSARRIHSTFLLITNFTYFFMYLFISSLYMFRASHCSSSGDRIVLIHHLVWLVCVSDCLVCRFLTGIPSSHLHIASYSYLQHIDWNGNTPVRHKLKNRASLEACQFITKLSYNPSYTTRLTT